MAVLSRRVRPNDWKPVGVDELEANALRVVRSADNRSVIAGPGAGKTELLAQRAAYLLQTGTAPSPRRILAISFKRDAATNLAVRVRQRCHRNCVFRTIRPVIPATSGHLNRGIRPPLFSGCEA